MNISVLMKRQLHPQSAVNLNINVNLNVGELRSLLPVVDHPKSYGSAVTLARGAAAVLAGVQYWRSSAHEVTV